MSSKICSSIYSDRCLITGKPVKKILDFGQHAYADTFIAEHQLDLSEPVFPLQVMLNEDSGSLQLGYMSDARERYTSYSYCYTSSNSKISREHWDEFASTMIKLKPDMTVAVEIGSNDGYLINQFKGNNTKAMGVDPSNEMCILAREKGVDTINGLFDHEVAELISHSIGKADIVMANNVFNHSNDPVELSKAVASLLKPDGMFVFEVPYWKVMIESNRFTDMVYHEHPVYFTVKMAWNVLKAAGLKIDDFDIVDYHGGSLRVFAKLDDGRNASEKIEKAILDEEESGIFKLDYYSSLQKKFENQRDVWLASFHNIRISEPEAVFIGVGAAAKANTWLNWHGLNKTYLHCITDSSPLKQGKYTPLSRISITGDEEFSKFANPYAIILSWNIGEGLRKALLNINPNIKFLNQ